MTSTQANGLLALARELLETLPANALIGVRVLRADAGGGVTALDDRPELHNVIGTVHAAPLLALVDASALAAVLGSAPSPAQVAGVVPLGRRAQLEFLAPATAPLTATTVLQDDARGELAKLYDRAADRVRLTTLTEIADAGGTVACRGRMDWVVRRDLGANP